MAGNPTGKRIKNPGNPKRPNRKDGWKDYWPLGKPPYIDSATPLAHLSIEFTVRGPNSGNRPSEHWGRRQQYRFTAHRLMDEELIYHEAPEGPVDVLLIRWSRGVLDSDNCVSGFKPIIDALCDWLGVDDGDINATRWHITQRKRQFAPKFSSRGRQFPGGEVEIMIFPRGTFPWPCRWALD